MLSGFASLALSFFAGLTPVFGQSKSIPCDGECRRIFLLRAEEQRISTLRQWKLLLHFPEKAGPFSQSAVLGGSFFLHPEGAKSPHKELIQTLESFLSEDPEIREKTQCHFLARRAFLFQELQVPNELKAPCLDRQKWKAQLNAKQLTLIFASSYLQSPSSAFGHTLLRFDNPDVKNPLLQYAINFAADVRLGGPDGVDPLSYAAGGLFGAFQGSFSMLPYHQKILEYSHLEGRDMWEFTTVFTESEIDMMLDHLWELQGSSFDYYFLKQNCSYQLLKLMEIVRPSLHLADRFHDVAIPLDTIKILSQNHLFASQTYRPSKRKILTDFYTQMGETEPAIQIIHDFTAENDSWKKKIQELNLSQLEFLSLYASLEGQRTSALFLEANMVLAKKRITNSDADKIFLNTSQVEQNLIQSPPRPPQDSHDSSQLLIGNATWSQNSEPFLEFRHAMHDVFSRANPYPEGSHLELASFRASRNPNHTSWDIDKLLLLKIVSVQPWMSYQKPWSWMSHMGFDHEEPFMEGGLGIHLNSDFSSHKYIDAHLTFLAVPTLRQFGSKWAAGGGGLVTALISWNDKLKIFGTTQKTWYLSGPTEKDQTRHQMEYGTSIFLSRNFELRLSQFDDWKKDQEFRAALMWNLIL